MAGTVDHFKLQGCQLLLLACDHASTLLQGSDVHQGGLVSVDPEAHVRQNALELADTIYDRRQLPFLDRYWLSEPVVLCPTAAVSLFFPPCFWLKMAVLTRTL